MIDAKKRGEKESNIAVWLKINVRSVRRIWKFYKETESIQPKARSGRKSYINATTITKIQNAVKSQPDITLEELTDELELPVKKSYLSVILIGLGFTLKKRHYSQKSS